MLGLLKTSCFHLWKPFRVIFVCIKLYISKLNDDDLKCFHQVDSVPFFSLKTMTESLKKKHLPTNTYHNYYQRQLKFLGSSEINTSFQHQQCYNSA